MAREEAQVSQFFYPALTFNNNMISYDRNNIDGQLDDFILRAIKNYAVNYLESLLELSEKCPVIEKYCNLDKPEFDTFWDMQVENNVIADQLGIEVFRDILPQDNIHSFYLIKACYWFHCGDHLRAIRYGSYHSGCVLLNAFIMHGTEISLIDLEVFLQRLAEIHRAPGQILLARLYLHERRYDQSWDLLESAKAQLESSFIEIHNAGCTHAEIVQLIDALQANITIAMHTQSPTCAAA